MLKDTCNFNATATLSTSELRRALSLLGRLVKGKIAVPVLAMTRVEITGNRVRLSTTDLDIALRLDLEAEASGRRVFLVRQRALAGFAAAAGATLRISHEGVGDAAKIVLESEDVVLRLNDFIPPEDWPEMSGEAAGYFDNAPRWEMSQDDVRRLLRLSRHCHSQEPTRYYLNGLALVRKPDGRTLRAVATDGHRMAVIDCDTIFPERIDAAIIPTPTIDILLAMTGAGANEPVRLSMRDHHHLRAEVGGARLISKLIDGTFPDYTRVIPSSANDCRVSLSGTALARLQKMWDAVAPKMSRAATFHPGRGTMTIAANGEAVELPAQVESERPEPWAFNLYYLADQGRVTPQFTATGKNPSDPFVIRGEDPDAFWILMPMRA